MFIRRGGYIRHDEDLKPDTFEEHCIERKKLTCCLTGIEHFIGHFHYLEEDFMMIGLNKTWEILMLIMKIIFLQ